MLSRIFPLYQGKPPSPFQVRPVSLSQLNLKIVRVFSLGTTEISETTRLTPRSSGSRYLNIQSRVRTLYNPILSLNDPEKETFWKHCGKRRKCWEPAFSPFLKTFFFFTLSKTELIIEATLNLSSTNSFNLVKAKILSSGKELVTLRKRAFEYFVRRERERRGRP